MIRKDRETFLTILENYPHGVALVLKDGAYRYVNQKFTEITGYSLKDTPTGRQWFQNAFPDPEYRRGVMSTWSIDMKRTGPGESPRSSSTWPTSGCTMSSALGPRSGKAHPNNQEKEHSSDCRWRGLSYTQRAPSKIRAPFRI